MLQIEQGGFDQFRFDRRSAQTLEGLEPMTTAETVVVIAAYEETGMDFNFGCRFLELTFRAGNPQDIDGRYCRVKSISGGLFSSVNLRYLCRVNWRSLLTLIVSIKLLTFSSSKTGGIGLVITAIGISCTSAMFREWTLCRSSGGFGVDIDLVGTDERN